MACLQERLANEPGSLQNRDTRTRKCDQTFLVRSVKRGALTSVIIRSQIKTHKLETRKYFVLHHRSVEYIDISVQPGDAREESRVTIDRIILPFGYFCREDVARAR